MKKKVYAFFAANPMTTHHQCARALDMKELDVLHIINELSHDGYLHQTPRPLGNNSDPDCSCFYSVSREYHN